MAPLAETELLTLRHTNDFHPTPRTLIEAPNGPLVWEPLQACPPGIGNGRLVQALIKRSYTVMAVDNQEAPGLLNILQN